MADAVATDAGTLDEVIASSDVPVLVELTADWCPPCRMMAPVLAVVAAELGDSVRVLTVDGDDAALRARFDVLALPTMLVFSGGVLVKRLVGARPRHRLLEDLSDL